MGQEGLGQAGEVHVHSLPQRSHFVYLDGFYATETSQVFVGLCGVLDTGGVYRIHCSEGRQGVETEEVSDVTAGKKTIGCYLNEHRTVRER